MARKKSATDLEEKEPEKPKAKKTVRKKSTDTATEPETAPEPAKTKATRSTRKSAVAEKVTEAVPEEEPKKTTRRKKAIEPVAEVVPEPEKPKKTATRRPAKASKVEPEPQATEEAEEPAPKKPRTRKTAAKKEVEAEEPVVEEAEPAVKSRSRFPKAKESVDDLLSRAAETALGTKPEEPAEKRTAPKARKPASKPTSKRVEKDELRKPVTEHEFIEFPEMEWRSATPKSGARPTPSRKEPPKRQAKSTGILEVEERRPGKTRRSAEKKEVAVAATPPDPEPPLKDSLPAIPIPSDAPQVGLVSSIPNIVIDMEVQPPLIFFASVTDEKRLNNALEEVRMATDAGVELFSFLVDLPMSDDGVEEAVQLAGYLVKKVLEINPKANLICRMVVEAPNDWAARYPNAKFVDNFGRTAGPSFSDDEFWEDAQSYLERFVKLARLVPNGDRICGVHLDQGEWFFSSDTGYDTSRAAFRKFREWCRVRYSNTLEALQAAWFDGTATFETLRIPDFQTPSPDELKLIRTSKKDQRYVDYHLFLSDQIADRIGQLAYAVKAASEGRMMVGTNYGYTFEWSHPYSGHLSLGKLLRTEEIDWIAGPPSYRSREPGGVSPLPAPVDSFVLNNKLFVSEEDYKTSIAAVAEPDDYNPVIRSPQALESVHLRGLGAALAGSTGLAWMDLWGNGWLKMPSVWTRGKRVADLLMRRLAAEAEPPEVALFIDERSLAYLIDPKAFELLVHSVREAAARSGISVGYYLLSDLAHRENFPESKLYIFLNAWDIRSEYRSMIKSRLQKDGKTLFWLYGASLFDRGREALERAREITGIALKAQPFFSKSTTRVLPRRHPLTQALLDHPSDPTFSVEPSYFAIPDDLTTIAEYSQTGLPSFVVKEFLGENEQLEWRSIFMGQPNMSTSLMRALAQLAGAHVWSFEDDVFHVRPPFLTVHCKSGGPKSVHVPEGFSAFDWLEGRWVEVRANTIRFQGIEGATYVFLVGEREQIEQILSAEPDELRQLDGPPIRSDNTVRFDAFSFDIPVMKIDEYVEAQPDSESSEDQLLSYAGYYEDGEVEEDEVIVTSQKTERRRRKSRRKAVTENQFGRMETRESSSPLNVMFRSRE